MSSLLKTKPSWCPAAIATDRGWVNPVSNELLVSFKNLRTMLNAEEIKAKEEEILSQRKPKKTKRIIAEVMEYDIDTNK